MEKTNGQEGLRIVRAEAIGCDALDIALSNGNIILLKTELILALPGFEGLGEDDRILYPKTDYAGIYWRDGPRLGIGEIFSLLKANSERVKEEMGV